MKKLTALLILALGSIGVAGAQSYATVEIDDRTLTEYRSMADNLKISTSMFVRAIAIFNAGDKSVSPQTLSYVIGRYNEAIFDKKIALAPGQGVVIGFADFILYLKKMDPDAARSLVTQIFGAMDVRIFEKMIAAMPIPASIGVAAAKAIDGEMIDAAVERLRNGSKEK